MAEWMRLCPPEKIDPEDVIRFSHAGRSFAVDRIADGTPFATDGRCTHERVRLPDGLVMGDQIECPKHNGRFTIRTGAAPRAPVRVNLTFGPTRVVDGQIEIEV